MKTPSTHEIQILLTNRVSPAVQDWEVDDSFSMLLTDPKSGTSRTIELDPQTYARVQEFLTSARDFIAPQDF
jgi:hypothetical protein